MKLSSILDTSPSQGQLPAVLDCYFLFNPAYPWIYHHVSSFHVIERFSQTFLECGSPDDHFHSLWSRKLLHSLWYAHRNTGLLGQNRIYFMSLLWAYLSADIYKAVRDDR